MDQNCKLFKCPCNWALNMQDTTMILYESLVDEGSPTKSLMPRSATYISDQLVMVS